MQKLGYLPSLDGIRAISALIVFASHVPGIGTVIPGGLGVTVFFFLSGFIITSLLRIEFENKQSIDFRGFYLRRVFRIFPPLYIVLTISLALGCLGVVGSDFTTMGAISSFFHFTNYYYIFHGEHVGNLLPGMDVTWSLAIEEHFYLIFPILFVLLRKNLDNQTTAFVLASICLGVLAWRFHLYSQDNFFPRRIFWATSCRIDSILFGCILALWKNPAIEGIKRLPDSVLAIFLSLSIAALIASLLPRSFFFREVIRYTIQGLALMPIFFLAIAKHDWWIFRILNTRILVGMGKISYTFYLCHRLFLQLVDHYIENQIALATIIAFVCAVVFSTLMYFAVEKPMARLRKKLH